MLFRLTLDSVVVTHDMLPLVEQLLAATKERIAYMEISDKEYASCIIPVKQYHGFQLEYVYAETEAEYRLNGLAHMDRMKAKEKA